MMATEEEDPKVILAKEEMKKIYKRGINIYSFYHKVKNKLKRDSLA